MAITKKQDGDIDVQLGTGDVFIGTFDNEEFTGIGMQQVEPGRIGRVVDDKFDPEEPIVFIKSTSVESLILIREHIDQAIRLLKVRQGHYTMPEHRSRS